MTVSTLGTQGGMVSMRGGIGYRFGPAILAPTVSWNIGLCKKTGGTKEEPMVVSSITLPLQWWSVGMNLYLWTF